MVPAMSTVAPTRMRSIAARRCSPAGSSPGWLRPPVRWMGRRVADRIVRGYQRRFGVVIDQAELAWYQAVACLRALVEMAGWTHAGQ
jgi:hypothetical protein